MSSAVAKNGVSCKNNSTPVQSKNTFFSEALAKDTPEYIHPRKYNIPQWLMSPPAINEDLIFNDCIKQNSNKTHLPVRPKLLRPDDIMKFHKLVQDSLVVSAPNQSLNSDNILDVDKSMFQTFSSVPCMQSVLQHFVCKLLKSNACKNCQKDHVQVSEYLSEFYFQDCKNLCESLHKLHLLFLHQACSPLLNTLSTFSLCTSPHQSQSCIEKLFPIYDANSNTISNSTSKKFPIGVFWDIENCQVPVGKSALDIVQKIRSEFFSDHCEAEFIAVCDINKETKQVIQDLNDAQVDVIHVNATAKNAADDKLRQSIHRYAHTHQAPASVILITGDCNFASEVGDLRHRHNFFVLLMHNSTSSDSFKQIAHTKVLYEDFVKDLPIVYLSNELPSKVHLYVTHLPSHEDHTVLRSKLKQLSSNCGGRVLQVSPYAVLRFNSQEHARRALKRLNGEVVFGSKISVTTSRPSDVKHLPRHRVNQAKNVVKPSSSAAADGRSVSSSSDSVPQQSDDLSPQTSPTQDLTAIPLTITNIDSQLGFLLIQQKIEELVSRHTMLLQSNLRPHNRFTVVCDFMVPSKKGAISVLESLHRVRLGEKRILITVYPHNPNSPLLLRNEVLPLMKQSSSKGIPFHQLATLYNDKYCKTLKVAYLHTITDIVTLEERANGLVIYLKKNGEKTASFECRLHRGVAKSKELIVDICLREFSARIHILLHTHAGVLFLDGLDYCYQAEFGSFPYAKSSGSGVTLEHMLSYVPGVLLMEGHVKAIVWSQSQSEANNYVEPALPSLASSSKLTSFSKEIIDVMKSLPEARIPLVKFEQMFKDRIVRCFPDRESNVNFRSMISAFSHVIQVIGRRGNESVILSHRTQVKRFTQELVKILKNSPTKSIKLSQLSESYMKVVNRAWKIYDYGVNDINDLLDDIPDGNICVHDEGGYVVLSLPTRERSQDEIQRTAQFSRELIEVLKIRPRCRIVFKDFIPAYHRYFGRQCKLSKFGFNKLIDLFEALPHVVQVVDDETGRYLQLTKEERMKVLTTQIIALLQGPSATLPLERLQSIYARKYGSPLIPLEHECHNIEELVKSLSHALKLVPDSDGSVLVKQSERKPIRLLSIQLLVLLLDIRSDEVELDRLHSAYLERYKEDICPLDFGFLTFDALLSKAMSGMAKVHFQPRMSIALQPIYSRAKRIRTILLQHDGNMTLGEFNRIYREQFFEPLDVDRFGFSSCEAMLRALTQILTVKGFGIKKRIVLRNHMRRGPLSHSLDFDPETHPDKPSCLFIDEQPYHLHHSQKSFDSNFNDVTTRLSSKAKISVSHHENHIAPSCPLTTPPMPSKSVKTWCPFSFSNKHDFRSLSSHFTGTSGAVLGGGSDCSNLFSSFYNGNTAYPPTHH